MSKYIGFVTIGSDTNMPVASTLYGTCSTIATTATKEVTLDALTNITSGITVHVKFTNGNSAVNPTLVFSGMSTETGIAIKNYAGNDALLTWKAGAVISFTYDGTYWVMNDSNVDISNISIAKNQITDFPTLGDASKKGIVTDISGNSNSTDLPTAAAIVSYVLTLTAGLSGLTGAMHFRGSVQEQPTNDATSFSTYESGDVILYNTLEYVYVKGDDVASSSWVLLGDEGSYALATAVINKNELTTTGDILYASAANTPARLAIGTTGQVLRVVDGVPTWQTIASSGSANVYTGHTYTPNTPTSASVSNGVLTITSGTAGSISFDSTVVSTGIN